MAGVGIILLLFGCPPLLSAVIGAISVRLRQPLIVAFIAAGILVGPSVLGWVSADDQIDLLAKPGIALDSFVIDLDQGYKA